MFAQAGSMAGGLELRQPRELPLDLVGVDDHGVQTDHLDCAGGLMDAVARLYQQPRIRGRRAESREEILPSRERLADFPLHPRQRARIEIGNGLGAGGGCRVHHRSGWGSAAARAGSSGGGGPRRVIP